MKIFSLDKGNATLKAFSVIAFSLFVYLFSYNYAGAAGVAVYTGPCTLKPTTAPTGADGSDCDSGLVCDASMKKCHNQNETICSLAFKCSLGNICMKSTGTGQVTTATEVGFCEANAAASAENNAFGEILCNSYKVVTGKAGRGIVVIVLFVTGVTFYLGKVSWGSLLAVAGGAGFCFGGQTIVGALVGKGFQC